MSSSRPGPSWSSTVPRHSAAEVTSAKGSFNSTIPRPSIRARRSPPQGSISMAQRKTRTRYSTTPPLVLDVDGVDATNNLFAGTIDVSGAAARLEVNLSNPLTAWRVTSAGVVNFSTASAGAVTMLDGSDVTVDGQINATGRVRLGANVGAERHAANSNQHHGRPFRQRRTESHLQHGHRRRHGRHHH